MNALSTPSESNKGGVLLYISNKLSFKPRNNLNIYKPKQLESISAEIIRNRKKNILVSCIYKHPTLSTKEFSETYISELLEKIYIFRK